MKFRNLIITLTLSACLITACGQKDTNIAIAIGLTQTAAAVNAAITATSPAPTLTATVPAATGTITGSVHLMAPPTPRMVVYAVDKNTGLWASTETQATNLEAPFSLAVVPGVYQIYAFAVDSNGAVGYSLDGTTLAKITVADKQTISGIVVRPPSQSDCGAMFGLPASPDGRFKAIPDPDANCIARVLTEVANTQTSASGENTVRIQFAANASTWYTPGNLVPNTTLRFVLYALQGQEMTVSLTTEPDSNVSPYATLTIYGPDGRALTPGQTLNWTGILPASQDYFIALSSLSQQEINYTLSVTIPAVSTTSYEANALTPIAGSKFSPVSENVCKILQEIAVDSLGVPFKMQSNTDFIDPISGETGQGCRLSATGNGAIFGSPGEVRAKLVKGFLGWDEQISYQADGMTGAMTALTRDMALVLINVEWGPESEGLCPSDQPLLACNIMPEQKLYIIMIQATQK